jgi:hypothetical protein
VQGQRALREVRLTGALGLQQPEQVQALLVLTLWQRAPERPWAVVPSARA